MANDQRRRVLGYGELDLDPTRAGCPKLFRLAASNRRRYVRAGGTQRRAWQRWFERWLERTWPVIDGESGGNP